MSPRPGVYGDKYRDNRVKAMMEVTDAGDAVEFGATVVTSKGETSSQISVSVASGDVLTLIAQLTGIARQRGWLAGEQRACDTPGPAIAQFLVDAAAETDMAAEDERYAASSRARLMLGAALGTLTAHMEANNEVTVRRDKLTDVVTALREGSSELDVKLAALPKDQRDAWEAYQRGEGAFLRLLPHNGFDCYAKTHGGTCGYPLLIDGSCPNHTAHVTEVE